MPSVRSRPWIGAMWGWFNDARACFPLKPSDSVGISGEGVGKNLDCYGAFQPVSLARYTSPIPPAPSADRTCTGRGGCRRIGAWGDADSSGPLL